MGDDNKGSGKWTEKDTEKATDATAKQTKEAFHDARDDAEKSGEIQRGSGPGEKNPGEATEAYSHESLKEIANNPSSDE